MAGLNAPALVFPCVSAAAWYSRDTPRLTRCDAVKSDKAGDSTPPPPTPVRFFDATPGIG